MPERRSVWPATVVLRPMLRPMLRLLAALCTCTATATATYGCNNGQRAADGSDLGHRPAFHFYPDTIESQDISGPIKINSTWHVFMDCVPEGCPALVQPVQDKPLSWCHFSSPDLVHWAEHPIAIAPDRPFDGSIIDTGAVFQHPNGTVLAIYATSNIQQPAQRHLRRRHLLRAQHRPRAARLGEALRPAERSHRQPYLPLVPRDLPRELSAHAQQHAVVALPGYRGAHGAPRPRGAVA